MYFTQRLEDIESRLQEIEERREWMYGNLQQTNFVE